MALFDFIKKLKKREKKEKALDKKEKVEIKEEEKKETKDIEKIEERFREGIVITSPYITEKSRDNSEKGLYTFRVSHNANKNEIKKSVEDLYHVNVKDIKIINIPQKPRRRGLTLGSKKGYKKAIVSLKKGEKIELF